MDAVLRTQTLDIAVFSQFFSLIFVGEDFFSVIILSSFFALALSCVGLVWGRKCC